MSIHRTSAGTYRVRWRHKGRLKSKTFKRKVDAEKWQAAATLDQVVIPGAKEKEKKKKLQMKFRELVDIWLRDHAEVRKAPSSVIRDKQMLRDYILPALGHLAVEAIERRDFTKLQSKLVREGKLAPKTINSILSLSHKIMEDAVFWGYAEKNPAKGVRPVKIPETEYRFWTIEERDKFLAYAKEHNYPLWEVVAFTVHTGLRRGEVEGLLRDCIDFDRKEVIVKRNFCHKTKKLNEYTKGKNIRRVPLNRVALLVLESRKPFEQANVIFDYDFEHVTWRYLRPLTKKAGVREISYHDLRHSFASHLAMAGVSVWKIQKVLGHADIKTTMRYMHLAPGELQGITSILES